MTTTVGQTVRSFVERHPQIVRVSNRVGAFARFRIDEYDHRERAVAVKRVLASGRTTLPRLSRQPSSLPQMATHPSSAITIWTAWCA